MREFVAMHASEVPVADDKAESAVIPDAGSKAPDDHGAGSQPTDTKADDPSGATATPQSKPRRARQ